MLQQANVPETGIALILGVDRILDMLRTAVNITGDLTGATFVARTEGELVETDATSLELGEGPAAREQQGRCDSERAGSAHEGPSPAPA